MKKLFALLLVLTFTFVSCSDDDDDEYSNSDIVGTWVLESASAKEVKTNNDKATESIEKERKEWNRILEEERTRWKSIVYEIMALQ